MFYSSNSLKAFPGFPYSYLNSPPPAPFFGQELDNSFHHHHEDLLAGGVSLPSASIANMAVDANVQVSNFLPAKKKPMRKDRHSKICTAQGLRDRRVRLSIKIAREFFDLQDMLGFDKASQTLDWLLTNSRMAIKELTMMNEGAKSREAIDNDDLEVIVPASKKIIEPKKMKKDVSHILSKEYRAKARARARERTREKWCNQRLDDDSKKCSQITLSNHNLPQNWDVNSSIGPAITTNINSF